MIRIPVTDAERAAGQLSAEHLQQAVDAIKTDGFVVLEDVVDLEHIAILRDRLNEDVKLLVNRPDAPFNWVSGNVQQDPPPFAPYLFRDVLVNEFAIQVTKQVMGKGMKNGMYSGNNALPSDQRQPVHADSGCLWPNLEHSHPPYALVVNVPLVDMGPENGSTEIWPGTHVDTTIVMQDGDIKLPADVLEARRAVSPPLQPEVRQGSILIRDIRLWHAGMPNRTQTPRPMIAMIHYVGWWPTGPIRFAKEAEELLEHPDLWTHATYVDASEIDHIAQPGAYEYEAQRS